ncbi:MAG: peptide chain release factor 3 [Saccharofermentans sp.]|jgi:peptide chain release factor 3|nr:peptide chain release factor 3 [Mageeibacillus sp.]MCI1264534.1 peptide chain release factor 3 [Saccharofermentans sp.]MCI1274683.1 peptide chain release factor 3 [Saccharofermentans sp.]MCI2044565.1 peptide chain release factor 3 [Mageeibacillus sp.]
MNYSTEEEIRRRRTFAIISHPDAGKTTMTEKLLLYGGAIHMAGSVKARKASHHATSDWMEIEKKRGISVTSSVMQFEYDNYCINILDTPGHQDFSEDTYRTLCAADAAVMLLDGAKGVEAQTIKLFEVCRKRGIPIFTFINKMDRAAKNPFDLIDELEKVLGIRSCPINWPIGTDGDFEGVFERETSNVLLFDRTTNDHGASMVTEKVTGIDDPALESLMTAGHLETLRNDIELLDMAGDDLDMDKVSKGLLTPVFFGSAITNFGVEPFLRTFLKMSPMPQPHHTSDGTVEPLDSMFSGFVFKIQANMDPNHRDRMAFIRVCSGKYEKNMTVNHMRTGKKITLAQPQQFMAQDRTIAEDAYAGDIIGIFDPGNFRIGDTIISTSRKFDFDPIPVFAPENFARVEPKDSMKRKQFLKGIEQLSQEGAVQLYKQPNIGTETYVMGVVGVLQFDVLEYRLNSEYGVEILRTPLPYRLARWVKSSSPDFSAGDMILTSTSLLVIDRDDEPVVLFESDWAADWAVTHNEKFELRFENIHTKDD